METYKFKFTELQNDIFRLMCIKTGKSLNLRTTANLLKVSPTAVGKAVRGLIAKGLLKVERSKTMNLVLIQLNRDNPKAMKLKRVENLRKIYELNFDGFLEENFPGSTIVLFGSFSRGDDTTSSDIDIAIINSKEKAINLDGFEREFERKIYLHFYRSLKGLNEEFKENICNGILLAGGVEL